MNIIEQWVSEGSGWSIESVDSHYINITKYNPLKGSSYVKHPYKLENNNKGLINIKNDDNECFRWCHIRYLNPQDKNPHRIKKGDREYIRNLNYSGIELPITINQINKIEKRNDITNSVTKSKLTQSIFPKRKTKKL